LLGTAGIKLTNHPDFRDYYKLMGNAREKLQFIFDNDAVLNAVSDLNVKPYDGLICLEGNDQFIFIYPLYQQIPVRRLRAFLDRVVNLSKAINSTVNQ
jgi:hypothetical protein